MVFLAKRIEMGKKKMMSFGKFLDGFCLTNGGASSCLCCINNFEIQDDYEFEKEPLVDQSKDASDKPQTLGFFLKPKVILELRSHSKHLNIIFFAHYMLSL